MQIGEVTQSLPQNARDDAKSNPHTLKFASRLMELENTLTEGQPPATEPKSQK